jgi:hypothetical protein
MRCSVTARSITNSSVQLAHGVLAYLLPALLPLQLLLLPRCILVHGASIC